MATAPRNGGRFLFQGGMTLSRYRPVYKKIWKDKDFIKLPKDAKFLFLYLITNESINNSGVYEIPIKTIAYETGISGSTVKQLLTNGCIKNVVYDLENEIVFITNARKYCRGGNPVQVKRGIVSEFSHTFKTPLWNLFLEINPLFKEAFSTVAQPLTNSSLPLPLPSDCSSDKKNKQNEDSIKVLDCLNLKADKKYRPTDSNLKFIISRLKDYSVVDCLRVIDAKTLQWKDDPKMNKYLRPSTIFNQVKFEAYVNEKENISQKPTVNKKLEIIKNWGEKHGQAELPEGNSGVIDVRVKN